MPKGGTTKPGVIDLQVLRTAEAMAGRSLQRSSTPISHSEQEHHQHEIRSCLMTRSQSSQILKISKDGDVASFQGNPLPCHVSLLFPIYRPTLATSRSHTFPENTASPSCAEDEKGTTLPQHTHWNSRLWQRKHQRALQQAEMSFSKIRLPLPLQSFCFQFLSPYLLQASLTVVKGHAA